MNWNFSQMAELFADPVQARKLLDGRWGIEKEAQRVVISGDLALTGHPAVFGDKMNNPEITTDFAESQVEMITPPFGSVEAALQSLTEIQRRVEAGISDELLWPLSMPPRLPDERDIPISRFNPTSAGREMELYRKGLALRYGKKMQMISGIHYNFSFGPEMIDYLYRQFGKGREKGDFVNELYLGITRNFLRYRWLLIYLFGASPSVDDTYDTVIRGELETIGKCCPEWRDFIKKDIQYATSLRVSRFGYANSARGGYPVFFNSLPEYVGNLRRLLTTKSREFSELGLCKNGEPIQLNDNVLQKESEFYAPIRLKQMVELGETHLEALKKRGVRYLEVRILDLNPFEKSSVNLEQLRFLQTFMLFCLFEPCDPLTETELDIIDKNHHAAALFGRNPNLKLEHPWRGPVGLSLWAGEIFSKLRRVAELIDRGADRNVYQSCIENESAKVSDRSLLPSTRIQREMEERRERFLEFGVRRAVINRQKPLIKEEGVYYGYVQRNGTFHSNVDQGSLVAGNCC